MCRTQTRIFAACGHGRRVRLSTCLGRLKQQRHDPKTGTSKSSSIPACRGGKDCGPIIRHAGACPACLQKDERTNEVDAIVQDYNKLIRTAPVEAVPEIYQRGFALMREMQARLCKIHEIHRRAVIKAKQLEKPRRGSRHGSRHSGSAGSDTDRYSPSPLRSIIDSG
ncbi:hypothetical protein AOQ84DRAFT_363534 [Glonium stellatum]|uniref:Uncharacterized protein n=1 Tax=Glonium stellatum TaxID=574774 RepID=A0A8E2F387_9PEZI|nr:hypothetical protein AOQ84DRAFT_363534 [Glonium stellatum]